MYDASGEIWARQHFTPDGVIHYVHCFPLIIDVIIPSDGLPSEQWTLLCAC